MKFRPLFLSILVALIGAMAEARYLESYTARLSGNDHYSSRGIPLRRVADILQQDRANFHRFGLRDPEDTGDGYFRTRSRRARMSRMLRRGWIEPGLAREILSGAPLVRVDIYSRYIEVKRIQETSPRTSAPNPVIRNSIHSIGKTPTTIQEVKQDLLRRLRIHAQNSDYGLQTRAPLTHSIISILPCKEAGSENLWILTESKPAINFNCHACAPALSLFKYRWNKRGWTLEQERFAIDRIGGYDGGPDAKDVALVQISPDRCALAIRSGYATQGWGFDYYTLLGPSNGSLEKIFDTTLAADNGGVGYGPLTSWETKLRLRPVSRDFYLIYLERKGTVKGRPVHYEVSYSYRNGRFLPDGPDPLGKK